MFLQKEGSLQEEGSDAGRRRGASDIDCQPRKVLYATQGTTHSHWQ